MTHPLPAAALLLGLALTAQAHEGHDHGQEAPATPAAAAPRFEARTDSFELLGVLEGQRLVLWLDRADTNAPVTQATLELESGAWTAQATAQPDGRFSLAAGPLARPGQHPLVITVGGEAGADLLDATLVVPAAGDGATPDRGTLHKRQGLAWATAALLAVAAGVAAARWRRARARRSA